MSPFVWMFISSYEQLRNYFIDSASITSLIQLEYSGFDGATVPICTFTIAKKHTEDYSGSFIRLSNFKGADQQGPKTLEAVKNPSCGWLYRSKPIDFKKIPGSPIAYWIGKRLRSIFNDAKPLGELAPIGKGLDTGDNKRFLRLWHEIDISNKNWVNCLKGGSFRRWYGNFDYKINWGKNGEEIKSFNGSNLRNEQYYFKPGLSWSRISSGQPSFRHFEEGCVPESTGPCIFISEPLRNYISGFVNSNTALEILKFIAPTLDFQSGHISKLPILIDQNSEVFNTVTDLIEECVSISEADWNSTEQSLGFSKLGFIANDQLFQKDWLNWANEAFLNRVRLKEFEIQINKIFVNLYGLEEEVSSEVSDDQITLLKPDREKDCQRLISYAIGCMMGRYSLDEVGLVYAHSGNVGFEPDRYATFPADADAIVPITDELWFDDDAPSRIREFLRAVWGPDTLEENMAWLAESIGTKASETPDETIRRYVADKFFKDHLQTYKKRPIYWLFSSGKQGAFQALVYLHRYSEGTLSRLRAEYVVPLTGKIQSRIEMLQKDAAAASSTAARNKLAKDVEKLKKKHLELMAYDEQLRHYADMRITLDLDDGVKVNYAKFGDLLAEVKVITGGASDD